ncbi:MAG: triose-phosphate isomerase [Candidatus Binatia bacterium]
MIPPLVVGNWKMHGGQATGAALARQIVRGLQKPPASAQVVLAPPFTALSAVKKVVQKSPVQIAAQNSHWQDSGPFTGEISAAMLAEIGCEFVIIGHSERRHIFHESDERIAQKVIPVIKHGMRPILCVGETIDERRAEQTSAVITRQLDSALKDVAKDDIENIEIAYEPVWAIGTGHNATAEQIRDTHAQIRNFLNDRFDNVKGQQMRILYGGSVKPENAGMLAQIDELNGLLVGGASLTAESFLPIVRAFSNR